MKSPLVLVFTVLMPITMPFPMNAGYQYHFNRKAGWEILHIGYFSTFAKGLTTELADKYSVNPSSIERLNLVLSSHFDYIFMNGKFVFFEEYIRYFRTSVMLGGSFVLTNFSNYIAGDIGLRFEIFSGKVFTWKLEIRDSIAFATATQYVTFNLGIGFDF